jgi:hypothetical protein
MPDMKNQNRSPTSPSSDLTRREALRHLLAGGLVAATLPAAIAKAEWLEPQFARRPILTRGADGSIDLADRSGDLLKPAKNKLGVRNTPRALWA